MSHSDSIAVNRFGTKEASPSKSGQSRLDRYFQQLKKPDPNTNDDENVW